MEIHEQNYKECPYCYCSYYEGNTGYTEYGCKFWNCGCNGGNIEYGCPLSFKFEIEK